MIDLLIIGAGLSGLCAAHAAAAADLRVRVVATGMGATHWGAGTVDVLGYYPRNSREPVQRPLEAIRRLADEVPAHPYGLMATDRMCGALDTFVALTRSMGLPYRGAQAAGHNLLLPSPMGAPRPTYLAPQAQLAGDLGRPEPMLIVGFRDMRDFYPQLIAENLGRLGQQARSAFLPLSLVTERRDINTLQLARLMDEPARRARLAAALAGLIRPGERVGLPAVLGFHEHDAALAELEGQTGAPIFEIPTLPPSVPGIRLHTALCDRLARMGVRVEMGMEATGFHAEGDRIRRVETTSSARPVKHRAAHFLLATGGVLGGGFDSDHTGRIWEVVFNLPLTVPQERSRWFRPAFLDAQPVFQGGIPVDHRFQPLAQDGTPVYANLWAAGSALVHADPIHERSLEGIAVTTGMAAVEHIRRG